MGLKNKVNSYAKKLADFFNEHKDENGHVNLSQRELEALVHRYSDDIKLDDHKKWQLKKYYRNTQWFWLMVFLVNILLGLAWEGGSGAVRGLSVSVVLFILYSMLIGRHPQETFQDKEAS